MDQMCAAIASLDKGKAPIVNDPDDHDDLELAEIPIRPKEMAERPNNPICRMPSIINEYLIKVRVSHRLVHRALEYPVTHYLHPVATYSTNSILHFLLHLTAVLYRFKISVLDVKSS